MLADLSKDANHVPKLTSFDYLARLRIEIREMQETQRISNDLLDYALTIIENVNGGDWEGSAPDWHLAAITWRDRYHELRERG